MVAFAVPARTALKRYSGAKETSFGPPIHLSICRRRCLSKQKRKQMINQFLYRDWLLAFMLFAFVTSLGCEQQRYQPAVWQPAEAGGTLPPAVDPGNAGGGVNGGSLPFRSVGSTLAERTAGTLPLRTGASALRGSTLVTGSTLAVRGNAYRPARKSEVEKPPLPNIDGQGIWDASPKEQMRDVQGKPGLYSFGGGFRPLARNGPGSTLPNRSMGAASTLPRRNGFWGSTVPVRPDSFDGFGGLRSTLPRRSFGSPMFGGSTVPVRGTTLPANY